MEGAPPRRSTRVLVADDTDSIRVLFEKLLTTDGYQVTSIPDGLQALEAAQTIRPDVILLDVNMPGMDGIEVCRRLGIVVRDWHGTQLHVRRAREGRDCFRARVQSSRAADPD